MSKRYGFAGHECLIVFAITSILAAVLEPLLERICRISWWFSWPLAIVVAYALLAGYVGVRDYADRIKEARHRK